MGSSIYTRTGDRGTTSLVDGTRTPKESTRVEAYGAVDEANSWVGAARAFVEDTHLDRILEFLQHKFYNCSSNIATPAGAGIEPVKIHPSDVQTLERSIDVLEERSGPIAGFVLPGGVRSAGLLHVARTVCRRAERRIWALSRDDAVDENVVKFVNRSSDLLFAAARYANAVEGQGDVLWDSRLRDDNLDTPGQEE